VGEQCRCHRPFETDGRCWWPLRDPEPDSGVRVVVVVGDDPSYLRMQRVPGGWHGQGAAATHPELTAAKPWSAVGRCWDGRQHPVIDATEWAERVSRSERA
jgi:hypothetical protein